MVSISAIRLANATFAASYRPVALFVGGTSGIGRGTAEAFARATKGNAHIMICGRSRTAAESIIASFPQTPESQYEFIECDVSLMKNVIAVTESVTARVDTLNYLILSQGMLTLQGFTPTSEGIDMKLSLHFYSRWKFVDELMPLLERAKSEGQEARIMTVLDPAKGAPLDQDNLGLKKNYSIGLAASQGITYTNLMVAEYVSRYPQLSFIHILPGFVATNAARGLHWSLRLFLPVFELVATSLQDCGEYMLSALLSPAYRQGALFLDNHGEPIPSTKIYVSEAEQKVLREHFVNETSVS